MSSKRTGDRPILWLTRQPQGLVPTSQFDAEYLERYRIGSHLVCTVTQPRDEILNRKFHGLIALVAKGLGQDRDTLKRNLMIQAGCYHSVDVLEGVGTSFSAKHVTELDGGEFTELYWRVIEIITTRHLPQIDDEELLLEANKYLGLAP